jgi:hypothetical protein
MYRPPAGTSTRVILRELDRGQLQPPENRRQPQPRNNRLEQIAHQNYFTTWKVPRTGYHSFALEAKPTSCWSSKLTTTVRV